MNRTIFLISCVGAKLACAAPAKKLYTSEWFRKAYTYCNNRRTPDTGIYILSALYGLLSENVVIDPYDLSLVGMAAGERKIWAAKVLSSLATVENLTDTTIEILAGTKYREFLVPALVDRGATVNIPMEGLGIGQQLAYLKHNTRKVPTWK